MLTKDVLSLELFELKRGSKDASLVKSSQELMLNIRFVVKRSPANYQIMSQFLSKLTRFTQSNV